MQYTRNDVITVYRYLFPEPLEIDEYVCIPHGDPNGGKWNQERHVQTLDELLGWLDDRPNTPWNYGIQWQTKKLPAAQVNSRVGIGEHPPYRAWGLVVDIEDKNNHVYTEYSKALKKLWETPNSDFPDWLKTSADMIGYTGGGLHVYARFDGVITGADLTHMLYRGTDRPGALCETYDHSKNRWLDRGSFEASHGERLIGTPHPKYTNPMVVTKIARSKMGGSPIVVSEMLGQYQARIDYIADLDRKRAKKSAARAQNPTDNAYEFVKSQIDMIDYFGIEHRSRGTKFTPECTCVSPDHGDGTPNSVSVTHNGDGDYYKCFSDRCGFSGDCFDLYQHLHNCDKYEALKALAEHANVKLERYEQNTPAEGKEATHDIVDVASWLTGNGANLKEAVIYKYDSAGELKLGMRIPFAIKGEKSTLDLKWEQFKSPAGFRDAVMCQLLTSFSDYPKKAGPLIQFIESMLMKAGPGRVKDESIRLDMARNLVDQFWTVINSTDFLKPHHLAEWQRMTEAGIEPKDPPDYWSDAEDFLTIGRTCTVFKGPSQLFIRHQGVLGRLRMEYGNDWKSSTLVNILKRFKFHSHRPLLYGRRVRVYSASLEQIGRKLKK